MNPLTENWQHQDDEPLFPEVVWSKPETKRGAGKLAIIGGSAGSMAGVAADYAAAAAAGAGTVRVLVPDSLMKVTKALGFLDYGPSNPSGGFAKTAVSEMVDLAASADAVLLAGDFGKNSETIQALELFVAKYNGLLVLNPEAFAGLDQFGISLLDRRNTLLCLTLSQLRGIVISLRLTTPVTTNIGRPQIAGLLHEITATRAAVLAVAGPSAVWVAAGGRVADCRLAGYSPAKTAVWAMQQPTKVFEAVVSSVLPT